MSNSPRYEERVDCWVPPDKGAVHVKVAALPHNDPVELSAKQAREFAARLIALAAEVE